MGKKYILGLESIAQLTLVFILQIRNLYLECLHFVLLLVDMLSGVWSSCNIQPTSAVSYGFVEDDGGDEKAEKPHVHLVAQPVIE